MFWNNSFGILAVRVSLSDNSFLIDWPVATSTSSNASNLPFLPLVFLTFVSGSSDFNAWLTLSKSSLDAFLSTLSVFTFASAALVTSTFCILSNLWAALIADGASNPLVTPPIPPPIRAPPNPVAIVLPPVNSFCRPVSTLVPSCAAPCTNPIVPSTAPAFSPPFSDSDNIVLNPNLTPCCPATETSLPAPPVNIPAIVEGAVAIPPK